MQVAILTVGDEILAGDVVNTNAAWVAERLAERGVTVREIVTVPDEVEVIATRVERLADREDAVIVTGGVGGTPDDVTMDAVAAAFDRPLEVADEVAADLREHLDDPEGFDVEAWSALPAGAEPILNEEGLSPGCVLGNVYVFPGIPEEMKAMFESVADAFDGEVHVRTARSARPESDLVGLLEGVAEEFDVDVGSYPEPDGEKRIKLRGEERPVEAAHDWLAERL